MNEQLIETDIVVVGAGGCGLTASLVAAGQGKRVVLLERATGAGGSTAMSAGIIVAAGSQLQLANGENGTAEELAADIFRMNDEQSDARVTMALCRASGQLMDWLVAQGAPLEHMSTYRYPGMSRAWILSPPQRHGLVITEALLGKVRQQPNIDFRLRTHVTGLRTAGGSVNGLEARSEPGPQRPEGESLIVQAQAVILAASGFGANSELVKRYIPELAEAAYYGAPFATGDAIRWGQSLGAAVDHMSAYQSHSSIAYPKKMLVTTYLINHGAIQVNRQGQRFGDETDAYAGHALAVLSQPGQTVVELFDERILQQTLSDYPRFNECLEAGIIYWAQSLAELARQFDLPENSLTATVDAYNRAVRTGRDEFGRTRFNEPLTPPFYGIRVTSALVQTLGGLRVDERARVLREDGIPVLGLYAGGGTASGLAGERVEGYLAGAGLLAAFGLGWIAGMDAAR
jgi:fumarate reductase flavoprotein subunit